MDRIFSFLNILKIISNTDGFRNWINQYHQIEEDSFLLDGYNFFIEVVTSDLLESLHLSSAFDLEDDMTYYRAQFVGVNIDDIPNTSEKTVFIKNIWNNLKEIENASSWDDIKCYWQNNHDFFSIFDSIYRNNIICTKDIGKDLVLNATSIFYNYIFLNDTERGKPHTYPASILKNKMSPELMEKSYYGYIFCLQYVWYVLLGEEQFEICSLTELHRAYEKFSKNVIEDYEHDPFGIDYSDAELSALIKWESIDYFFPIIKSEIIEPLEDNIGINLSKNSILVLDGTFNKKVLSFLLSPKKLSNPDYMSSSDNESKIKKLDSYFLWQMFFKMDCKQIIIDGAAVFTDLLIGAVEKNKYYEVEDKIQILRIKHPSIDLGRFDYSYAILIESYSTFSDYSVWYAFFDCATDYSGFGGSLQQNIELFINENLEKNLIDVTEFTIEKEFFENYLDKGILSSITRIRNESEGILENAKGTALEHVACEVNRQIKQWTIGNQVTLKQNINNLIFILKENIPKNRDNENILKKIDEIELTNDVSNHYSIISLLIPQLLKLNLEETVQQLNSIDKKIDGVNLKVDELTNNHEALDFIIQNLEIIKNEIPELSTQINDVLDGFIDKSKSTEQKLKFSIPIIPTLIAYEIEKEVPKDISKRIRELIKLNNKLR
ncbi:hypothetical protein [Methanococcoides alaskense]|uniref:Uncharacterized protein n=1 Tax=Methanococcoides alaskense TaxID=325778 RepID=A0AA90TY52_9EURY|nr:hypothetical protein [Methanococcoides alaskense]MDA0525171.1 hypothetical protein [Methanococcoides alaskense]MDR6221908.1 hypothetical protein [Methanococcoides alaskense]